MANIEGNSPGWLGKYKPILKKYNIDPLASVQDGAVLRDDPQGLGFDFNNGRAELNEADAETYFISEWTDKRRQAKSSGRKALINTVVITAGTAVAGAVLREVSKDGIGADMMVEWVTALAPIVPAVIGFVSYKFHEFNAQYLSGVIDRAQQRRLAKLDKAHDAMSEHELTRQIQLSELSGKGQGFG